MAEPAFRKIRKVLIIKPSSMGDVVHALPVLYSLRQGLGARAELHWVLAEELAGLLRGHPLVNRLWVLRKDRWGLRRPFLTAGDFLSLGRALRAQGFDAALDLQGLLRSALIARLSGAPLRVGFREAREGAALLYTHKVQAPPEEHAVRRCLRVAEFMGFPAEEVFSLPRAEGFEPPLRDYAVLLPGARWPSKQWGAERFAQLARALPLKGLLLGGPGEEALARKIGEAAGHRVVDLVGRTEIRQMVELLRHARVVVGNDSGPLHVAAALGVPVVALFGPTEPERTGPRGPAKAIVLRRLEACPWGVRAYCRRRRCPRPLCIRAIGTQEVLEAVKVLL
jgi:lipopolysaccharide heptosyltransferase I